MPRELDLWRTWRASRSADPAALPDLLAGLHAWKAQHDEDRARQAGPFLKMAWDGVFGDDDAEVGAAIREIEAALDRRA
jgi:hypothetical protein